MKLGKYEALDNHPSRECFLDYVSALEMPVIDYVAIGIQDVIHKTSASMMSSLEWQKTFRDHGFAGVDPVRRASFNTQAAMFSFDELDCQDSHGKEVMRQRKKHNIENGIVLMRRNLGYSFMMTLATGYKNFHSYRFCMDHWAAINKTFDDLISFATPLTKEYQIKINNRLRGEAK